MAARLFSPWKTWCTICWSSLGWLSTGLVALLGVSLLLGLHGILGAVANFHLGLVFHGSLGADLHGLLGVDLPFLGGFGHPLGHISQLDLWLLGHTPYPWGGAHGTLGSLVELPSPYPAAQAGTRWW